MPVFPVAPSARSSGCARPLAPVVPLLLRACWASRWGAHCLGRHPGDRLLSHASTHGQGVRHTTNTGAWMPAPSPPSRPQTPTHSLGSQPASGAGRLGWVLAAVDGKAEGARPGTGCAGGRGHLSSSGLCSEVCSWFVCYHERCCRVVSFLFVASERELFRALVRSALFWTMRPVVGLDTQEFPVPTLHLGASPGPMAVPRTQPAGSSLPPPTLPVPLHPHPPWTTGAPGRWDRLHRATRVLEGLGTQFTKAAGSQSDRLRRLSWEALI